MSSAEAVRDSETTLPPEDGARAHVYRLLSTLLSAPASPASLAAVGALLGDASPLGMAIDGLAAASRETTVDAAALDYQIVFIGLGRGELLPYASYYLTGFLQEKPLARLRADMSRLGIVRDDRMTEPEDHVASILEVMAGLIDGSFGPQLTLPAQKMFYEAHVASWAGHFFADLEASETSRFYAAVGAVGGRFLEVETASFKMV